LCDFNNFYENIIIFNSPPFYQIKDAGSGNSWIGNDISGFMDFDEDELLNREEAILGTNPFLNDTEKDSIPDKWELLNTLSPFNASDAVDDFDFDGLINLMEYIYGTNPISFDSDGDGLNDTAEVFIYPTSPINPDTDNDILPDAWEIYNGTNPVVFDSLLDYDNDHLNNYLEYLYGTNPQEADTDGDSYSDGEEILAGTDPLNPADFPSGSGSHDYTLPIILGITFAGVIIALAILLQGFLVRKRGIKQPTPLKKGPQLKESPSPSETLHTASLPEENKKATPDTSNPKSPPASS
jgi:hypothetical protein